MAYQAKDSLVLGRQLEAQCVVFNADLVAGTSDAPSIVAIDSADIAAVEIVLSLGEAIEKCFALEVISDVGVASALDAAPTVDGQTITATLDATLLQDVCIRCTYKVQE